MKIKDLADSINRRLKEHSIAYARFEEGFFGDEVIVDHDKSKTYLDHTVTISKYFGWWYLRYKEDGDTKVTAEVKESENGNDDVREIWEFVNNHTMHETLSDEEVILDNGTGDWVVVDNDMKLALGESFETEDEAKENLEFMRIGEKEHNKKINDPNKPSKYDGYSVTTKGKVSFKTKGEE